MGEMPIPLLSYAHVTTVIWMKFHPKNCSLFDGAKSNAYSLSSCSFCLGYSIDALRFFVDIVSKIECVAYDVVPTSSMCCRCPQPIVSDVNELCSGSLMSFLEKKLTGDKLRNPSSSGQVSTPQFLPSPADSPNPRELRTPSKAEESSSLRSKYVYASL
jgi:hypothetical protein